MNTFRHWMILFEPLFQAVIAINLGMTLQRLDDGRTSSFTVIAISMSAIGLVLIVIAQTKQRLAATQSDNAGSRP